MPPQTALHNFLFTSCKEILEVSSLTKTDTAWQTALKPASQTPSSQNTQLWFSQLKHLPGEFKPFLHVELLLVQQSVSLTSICLIQHSPVCPRRPPPWLEEDHFQFAKWPLTFSRTFVQFVRGVPDATFKTLKLTLTDFWWSLVKFVKKEPGERPEEKNRV